MSRHRTLARARTRALLFAPLLALGLLVGPGVTGAVAHSELLDSDPAEGSTVEQVPEEIRLTFNETPEELGAALQLTGPDGEIPLTGEPRIEGNELAIDGPEEMPDGEYTLTFRITSADGHPISGELGFTVALAEDAETSPTESETATTEDTTAPPVGETGTDGAADPASTDDASTDEATTDEATTDEATTDEATTDEAAATGQATTEEDGAPAGTGSDTDEAAAEETDEGSNLPLFVGIGVLVLAVAGLGVYLAYRSSTRSGDDTNGPGGSAGGEA